MSLQSDSLRAARFAYPVGLLLVLAPLLELAGRMWPIQWYLVQWRFQSELAVLNATPVMLIGAFVVAVIAWSTESTSVLKLAGLLLVTFAVLLIPIAAMLVLDGMQMRQMARAELRGPLRNNIIIAAMRAGLAVLAAGGLGIACMQAAKALVPASQIKRAAGSQREGESTTPLLVSTAED
jgi:hypothetical protein